MSPDIQIRIPNLWYDFYARLLPGSAFIAVVRTFLLNQQSVPSFPEMAVILATGYFVAMLTQPAASRITHGLQRLAEKVKRIEDPLFVRRVQGRLGTETGEARILDKMHGEVACFAQVAILALV